MSIKSNIVTLKSWLSEKVKESYTTKMQTTIENLEECTKQLINSKGDSEINKTNLKNLN